MVKGEFSWSTVVGSCLSCALLQDCTYLFLLPHTSLGSFLTTVLLVSSSISLPGKSKETDEAGIAAVHSVTADARRIAQSFSPQRRTEVEKLCNEIDSLVKELAELQARGEVRDASHNFTSCT